MSSLAESERSPLAPRAARARAKPAVALAVALVLEAAGVLALLRLAAPGAERTAAPATLAGPSNRQVLAAYGNLPLAFVPNRGQTDARVRYSAQQAGLSVFFTRTEA